MTGWLGMITVLTAYWLLSSGRIHAKGFYHGLTGWGSLLLVIHNWGNWPMTLLSGAFVLASWRWYCRKHGLMF